MGKEKLVRVSSAILTAEIEQDILDIQAEIIQMEREIEEEIEDRKRFIKKLEAILEVRRNLPHENYG